MTEPAAPSRPEHTRGAAPASPHTPTSAIRDRPQMLPPRGSCRAATEGEAPNPASLRRRKARPLPPTAPPAETCAQPPFPLSPPPRGEMSARATVLKINSVSAVSAPSVIPAQAGIQATAQRCDEPPSARRPTRAPGAPRMIGRRRTLGARLTPTDRLDSCLGRNDGTSSSRASANIQGGLPHLARYSHAGESGPRPPSVTSASPPAKRGERGSHLFRALPGNPPTRTQLDTTNQIRPRLNTPTR